MASFDIEEFKKLLPQYGRLLGIDPGTKSIGLALSDERRQISSPLQSLARTKFSNDAIKIAQIVNQHSICGIVIGYPLNMDGSEGPRCQSTRQFARNLEQFIGKIPILLWDERLSSLAVERVMLEADLSRQRRSELVDKLAASYILQGILDRGGGL